LRRRKRLKSAYIKGINWGCYQVLPNSLQTKQISDWWRRIFWSHKYESEDKTTDFCLQQTKPSL